MQPSYDRGSENLGNIARFGHVNVEIPDQHMAQAFYVTGLGLTRDPYAQSGLDNMWVNIGREQFHLPTGTPTRVRGHTGLIMPNRSALLKRLSALSGFFKETQFSFSEKDGHVDVTCPWGNRIRVFEPAPQFAPIWLGIAYVEFEVPAGSAEGIVRFYRQVLLASADLVEEGGARIARVQSGESQYLRFREISAEPAPYDGHHMQIYVAQFGQVYQRLSELGLITREDSRHLYRFKDIKDPDNGQVLYSIEHEVRSMTHPLYMRPQVNRNPAVGAREYTNGIADDEWYGPPWQQPA